MMDNKLFWYGNMAGALFGWVFIFYGAVSPIDSPFLYYTWIAITLGWVIGHPLELTQSLPIAQKANVPLKTAIIKTLIFGLTWWIPLKRGIIKN